MVYVKECVSYNREVVLECISRIFEQSKVLDGVAGLNIAVKPNLVAKKAPETAATTHPDVVWAVCKLLKDAGANVVIAESPGGFYDVNNLKSLYRICGIEKAAKDSGAELNFDTSETEVSNPNGKFLKKLKILTPLAKADRIINIAKLKTHGMMTYTGAVKNMFGSIAGLEKTEYHFQLSDYDDFADCIIDIFLANSPVFNIIDAVVGMHKDGPTAGEPIELNTILAGDNAFELDLAGATLINAEYEQIPVFRQAKKRNLMHFEYGKLDVLGDELKINKNFIVKYNTDAKRLHFANGVLGQILSTAMRPRPVFDKKKCRACGECVKCCPAKVIKIVDKGNKKYAKVDINGCIRCYCCQELCLFKAVKIKRPLLNKIVIKRNEKK